MDGSTIEIIFDKIHNKKSSSSHGGSGKSKKKKRQIEDGNHVAITTTTCFHSSTLQEWQLVWQLVWNTYKVAAGVDEKTQATQVATLML